MLYIEPLRRRCNMFNMSNSFLDEKEPKDYILMSKDKPLLEFKYRLSLFNRFTVTKVYNENKNLLPYLLHGHIEKLKEWLDSRPIPANRENIEKLLISVGKDKVEETFEYLLVNNGVSLNDTFWIKDKNSTITFKDINLYENRFKESLGLVAFFGNTSSLGGNIRTPEFTTHGMLGKAWRQLNGKIFLYKKGTNGFANSGKEPYSEVIASHIANYIGLDHVSYELTKWRGELCTSCELFTNINEGFLKMEDFMYVNFEGPKSWEYSDVIKVKEIDIVQGINDMIVFDFIIENKDRHYSNFGIIFDTNTGKLLRFAPIFDNGFSLLSTHLDIDFKGMDFFNYSEIGTFGVSNAIQAKAIVKQNPKRYKHWAKILMLHLDDIDFMDLSEIRIRALKEFLKSRCKIIQMF